MPDSPPAPPPAPPHDQSTPSTSTSQENTRALLRSLEELRDSLSTRVEQLSGAVDRLRSQAGELERALEGDWIRPDGAVQSENLDHATAHAVTDTTSPTATSSPAPPASAVASAIEPTTAISRELSSLAQPISTDDIAILLDRASQLTSTTISNLTNRPSRTPAPPANADAPADGSDSWMIRAQTIENRIRRLSETARELRQRATQPLDTSVPAPAPAVVPIAQRFGLGDGWREEGLRNSLRDRPASYGSSNTDTGLSRSLERVREDQERLETNIRRLNNVHEAAQRPGRYRYTPHPPPAHAQRRQPHPHIPHVVIPPAMTRRNKSNVDIGVGATGRYPRSRGMPPTNVEAAAGQPAPLVVRSTLASPVPTATPLNSERESLQANIIPPTRVNTPRAGRNGVPTIDPNSDSPGPITPSQNITEGSNPMRGLARAIVDAAFTSPSRPGRNPSDARDDGMTYRGMTVASRMDGSNANPRAPMGTSEQWSMTIEMMLPALRRLLDVPGSSPANSIVVAEIGGVNSTTRRVRSHREVSIPPIDEAPMEETARLLQPSGDATQGLDETWTFTIDDAANARTQAPPPGDFRSILLGLDDSVSRTRTVDYTAALGGEHARATSPGRLATMPAPSTDGANSWVTTVTPDVNVFIDLGDGRVVPNNEGGAGASANPDPNPTSAESNANGDGMNHNSDDMSLPRPRSREDTERLRAERQAAINRLERSRASLRGMQRFRAAFDNSEGEGEARRDNQRPTISTNEVQSRENTNRVDAERQAAINRLERSRASLRGMQRFRGELNNSEGEGDRQRDSSRPTMSSSENQSREDTNRVGADHQAAINRLERSRASLGQMRRLRRDLNVNGEGGGDQRPTWSLHEIQSHLRAQEQDSHAEADEEGSVSLGMGMDMEATLEFGPTPTQGISAAGALNTTSDELDRSPEYGSFMPPSPRLSDMASTISAPRGDDEDGDQRTVYEGTGESFTVGPGGRRDGNTLRRNAKAEEKIRAPKEDQQSGLHRWPGSNVVSILAASDSLMSRGSRTYRSMAEL